MVTITILNVLRSNGIDIEKYGTSDGWADVVCYLDEIATGACDLLGTDYIDVLYSLVSKYKEDMLAMSSK